MVEEWEWRENVQRLSEALAATNPKCSAEPSSDPFCPICRALWSAEKVLTAPAPTLLSVKGMK